MRFSEHPVLGQVALGYAPMIDRHRTITARRLTVSPSRPEVAPDGAALLEAVAQVWPADGGRVSLNIVSEIVLHEGMGSRPAANLMIEVPSFMACDGVNSASLQAMHAYGSTLLIKGRPLSPVPREALPCFAYSIVGVADERRDGQPPPDGVSRTIPHIQRGVRTLGEMEHAFRRGAVAVLGWPMDDVAAATAKAGNPPEPQPIVERIDRVDRAEPLERLGAVLSTGPALASRLMRHLNSAVLGLNTPISSFGHAITMPGHQRLERWLLQLLASANQDPNMKPVMYAAVRRGLLMEELMRRSADPDERGAAFICGVFSLLDHLMGQPLDQLLDAIAVPDAVHAALVDKTGPFHPNLDPLRAVESESVHDIRSAAEAAMVDLPELNAAVLRALAVARQLD